MARVAPEERIVPPPAIFYLEQVQRNSTMSAYLYLITSESGLVKIGTSKSPEERLRTLQTGSPEKLHLSFLIELPDPKAAYQLESQLHLYYAFYRKDGEWYRISASSIIKDIEYCLKVASAINGITYYTENKPEPTENQISESECEERVMRALMITMFFVSNISWFILYMNWDWSRL